MILEYENFCSRLELQKSMSVGERNRLACTNDSGRLASRIDTSIAYISACTSRLRINNLMYEMGRMSEQKLREQTLEILGKITDEIVYIRDSISVEAFKSMYANDNVILERVGGLSHETMVNQ